MVAAARRVSGMTVPEFMAWEPGDGLRYELVDGEPRAMAPASPMHGLLQSEVNRIIGNHLSQHRDRCRIIANPGVLPRLVSAQNMREPDLGVTCSPVVLGQSALLNPVLLIEILSPSNARDTWSNVWAYTSIPELQEILVLHSTRISAELLRRLPEGGWPEQPHIVVEGDLHLESIDFHLPLADLYARTGLTA